MDCFAVSIAYGVSIPKIYLKHALKIALAFGIFQSLLAFLGAFFAVKLHSFLEGFENYLSAALLISIGLKMVFEKIKAKKNETENKFKSPHLKWGLLLLLALATSIDAFAAGFSLTLSKSPMVLSLSLIGAASFILSFLGVYIGEKAGHFFEDKMELIGGIILIGLGIKNFF